MLIQAGAAPLQWKPSQYALEFFGLLITCPGWQWNFTKALEITSSMYPLTIWLPFSTFCIGPQPALAQTGVFLENHCPSMQVAKEGPTKIYGLKHLYRIFFPLFLILDLPFFIAGTLQ